MSLSNLGNKPDPVYDSVSIPTEDRFPVLRRTISHAARSLFAGKLLFPIESAGKNAQHCFTVLPEALFRFKTPRHSIEPCFAFVSEYFKIALHDAPIEAFASKNYINAHNTSLKLKPNIHTQAIPGILVFESRLENSHRQISVSKLNDKTCAFTKLSITYKMLLSAFERKYTRLILSFLAHTSLQPPSNNSWQISETSIWIQIQFQIAERGLAAQAIHCEKLVTQHKTLLMPSLRTFTNDELKTGQSLIPNDAFYTIERNTCIAQPKFKSPFFKSAHRTNANSASFHEFSLQAASLKVYRGNFSTIKNDFSQPKRALCNFISSSTSKDMYISFENFKGSNRIASLIEQEFHFKSKALPTSKPNCNKVISSDLLSGIARRTRALGEYRVRMFTFWPAMLFRCLRRLSWRSPVHEYQHFQFTPYLDYSMIIPPLNSDVKTTFLTTQTVTKTNAPAHFSGMLAPNFRFSNFNGSSDSINIQNDFRSASKYQPLQKHLRNTMLVRHFKAATKPHKILRVDINNKLLPSLYKHVIKPLLNLACTAKDIVKFETSFESSLQNSRRYESIRERVLVMSLLANSPSLHNLHPLKRLRKMSYAEIELRMNSAAFSLARRNKPLTKYIVTLEAKLSAWRIHKQARSSRIVHLRSEFKHNFSTFGISKKLNDLYLLEKHYHEFAIHVTESILEKLNYFVERSVIFVLLLRHSMFSASINTFTNQNNSEFKFNLPFWDKFLRMPKMKVRFKRAYCGFSLVHSVSQAATTQAKSNKSPLNLSLKKPEITTFRGAFFIHKKKPIRSAYSLRNPRKWIFNFNLQEYIPAVYTPAGVILLSHPNRLDTAERIPSTFMGPAFRELWFEAEYELPHIFHALAKSQFKTPARLPFIRRTVRPTSESPHNLPSNVYLPSHIDALVPHNLAIIGFDSNSDLVSHKLKISDIRIQCKNMLPQDQHSSESSFSYSNHFDKIVMSLFDLNTDKPPASLVRHQRKQVNLQSEHFSNIAHLESKLFAARWRTLLFPYVPKFIEVEMPQIKLWLKEYDAPKTLSGAFGSDSANYMSEAFADSPYILSLLPINSAFSDNATKLNLSISAFNFSIYTCNRLKYSKLSLIKSIVMSARRISIFKIAVCHKKLLKAEKTITFEISRKRMITKELEVNSSIISIETAYVRNKPSDIAQIAELQKTSFKLGDASLYFNTPKISTYQLVTARIEHDKQFNFKYRLHSKKTFINNNNALQRNSEHFTLISSSRNSIIRNLQNDFTGLHSTKTLNDFSHSNDIFTLEEKAVKASAKLVLRNRFQFTDAKESDQLHFKLTDTQNKMDFKLNDAALPTRHSAFPPLDLLERSFLPTYRMSSPKSEQIKAPSVPDWLDIAFSERDDFKSYVDFHSSRS